jgi:hypothetical protein
MIIRIQYYTYTILILHFYIEICVGLIADQILPKLPAHIKIDQSVNRPTLCGDSYFVTPNRN